MTVLPQLERELLAAHDRLAPGRRRAGRPTWRAIAVPALAVLVVAAVVVTIGAVGGGTGGRRTVPGHATHPAELVFTANTTAPATALARDLVTLRARVHAFYPRARLARVGNTITVSGVPHAAWPTIQELAVPGHMAFYDWEADVLTPDGQTAASQLRAQNPAAIEISQGSSSGPGAPNAGAVPFAQATRLARRRPRGLVIQAASTNGSEAFAPRDFAARFYVLRGTAALTGAAIVNPRAGTDASGAPDVTFSFTPAGASAFQRMTAAVTHRGAEISTGGMTYEQHFAVAFDGHLLVVPSIDFRQYPDGIISNGSQGIDISGDMTRSEARMLAAVLRYRPLDVALTPR